MKNKSILLPSNVCIVPPVCVGCQEEIESIIDQVHPIGLFQHSLIHWSDWIIGRIGRIMHLWDHREKDLKTFFLKEARTLAAPMLKP